MQETHGWTMFTALPIWRDQSYMQCTIWRRTTARPTPRDTDMTIKKIASRLNQWRRYRVSVRELSRLSDRELNDLGIGRGDIEYVARKAVRAS